MRNVIKKAVSALLAVMTTAALSVTAFAAPVGYVTDPEFSASIPSAGASAGAPAGAVVSATVVESSSGGSVEAASLGSLTLRSSALKDLKQTPGAVLKIESKAATVSIDSATVTKARKIDLSMQVYGSATRSVIDMRSKKDFGCEVQITVKNCKLSAKRLASAHVYCDGEDLGPVELDENGYPVITVTKGGKYIIK